MILIDEDIDSLKKNIITDSYDRLHTSKDISVGFGGAGRSFLMRAFNDDSFGISFRCCGVHFANMSTTIFEGGSSLFTARSFNQLIINVVLACTVGRGRQKTKD